MRAAAFVRVSSDQQDFDLQCGTIRQVALARGDEIATWFEERESSQSRDGAELRRLKGEIAGGRVRKLYVYALDRLSRMGVYDISRHFLHFRHYGCAVVTCADPFDPDGPMGELFVAWFGWVAKQERERMRQRMADKKREVIAKGGRWGRPRRQVPEATRAAARVLLAQGLSIRDVAARLKVPKSTLQRALGRK